MNHLGGKFQTEPGNGGSRDSYLEDHKVETFLIIPPKIQSNNDPPQKPTSMSINVIEPDEESLKSPTSQNTPFKLDDQNKLELKSPNIINEENTEFKGISLNTIVPSSNEKRRLSVHGNSFSYILL